jgi:hypothetical protein
MMASMDMRDLRRLFKLPPSSGGPIDIDAVKSLPHTPYGPNERRKWHKRYLTRFDQVRGKPEFKKALDRVRATLGEEILFRDSAADVLKEFDLPAEIHAFILHLAKTGEEHYGYIHPPFSVIPTTHYDKRGAKRYSVAWHFTSWYGPQQIKEFVTEEWDKTIGPTMKLLPEQHIPRYRPSEKLHDQILKLRADGMSISEIARQLEVYEDTVKQVLRRKGRRGDKKTS